MIPTKRTTSTVNGTYGSSTDHSRRRKRNSSSNTIGIGNSNTTTSSSSRDRSKRIIPTTTTTTTTTNNTGNDRTPTVLTTPRMNTMTNHQSPPLPSPIIPQQPQLPIIPQPQRPIILPPILPNKYYPPPPKKKKKKLYDLRHEIDIGNVIAYQIRHPNPPPPSMTTTTTRTNTVPTTTSTTTTTTTTTNVTDIKKEEPINTNYNNDIHHHHNIQNHHINETETDDQTKIFQQLLSSSRCDDNLPPSGNNTTNNNHHHIVVATTTTSTTTSSTIPPKYEFHHHHSSSNRDNHHHHNHNRIHHSSKWKRDNMDDDDDDDDDTIGMIQHLDTHNNRNDTTHMVGQSIESSPPEKEEDDASSLRLIVHGHHDHHPKRRRRRCSTHHPQPPHPIGSRSNKSSHIITTCLPFYHHSAPLLSSLLWTNHCYNNTATTTTTSTPSSTTFTFQQRRIVFRIVTRSILLLQPPPPPLPSVPLSSLQHHHHHHVNNNMDTYRIQKNHNTNNMNPNIHSSSSLSFIPSPQQQKCIPTLWKLISYPYLYTIPTRTNNYHNNNGTQQLYSHHPSNSNSNSMTTTTTTTLPNPIILWSTKSILLDRICRQNGIDVLELVLPFQASLKHDHHNNLHHYHSNEEHHPSSTTTTTTTTTPTTLYNHHDNDDNVNQSLTRIMTSIELLPPSRIGLRMDTLPSLSSIPKEILSLPPNTVLIPSTTNYIPIPGTIPPTVLDDNSNIENVTNTSNTRKRQRYHRSPSSPILPVLFGPTDRNEHIVHTGHSIDESIYKITIASLLQQMSTTYDTTSSIYNNNPNSTTRILLQKQLLVLVQHIVRTNQNQYYKRLLRQWKLLPVVSSSSTITNNNTTTPSTTTASAIIPNFELPLAYLYHALMEYCSIRLSGMITTTSKSSYNNNNISYNDENDSIELDDEYDDNPNDRDPSHSDTTTNMIPIIEQVFEFLDVHIAHNGVQMFPRLHLIYGIVRICKMLPESGIAIVGQSFSIHTIHKNNNINNDNNDTPIQIFRTLLEHLDEKNYLVTTQSSTTNRHILNVGELEYTLYRSSLIFLNNCIQREPLNVQYHCWYIGTIASSLLLCSGQQIVSTFTNRTKQKRFQPLHHSSRAQKSIVFSTIRRPLPKFQELRKQTAMAFRELVQLSTTYPNHQMTHLAITSLLEWDQVMSLLFGPSMNSNPIPTKSFDFYYHHFRTLYRYHKTQWAHQENTTVAYQSLRHALPNDNDVYLRELASALESDPSNVDHWHALVQALGPIGQCSSSRCESGQTASTSEDAYCQECDRLVDGVTIDHDATTERNQNSKWWGYDRIHWWYECLLQPGKCHSTENKCSTVHSTSDKRHKGRRTTGINTTNDDAAALKANIMNELKNTETFHRHSGQAAPSISTMDDSIIDDYMMPPPPLEEWFETFLSYVDNPVTNNKNTINTKRKKTATNNHVYISFLPWTISSGDDSDSSSSRCDADSIDYRTNMDTGRHADDVVNIRMIGYKVLIVCHLYSVSHVSVQVYVQQLYNAIMTTTKIGDDTNTYHHRNNDGHYYSHPAYSILCWLYRMGLDVTNDINTINR